MARFKLWGHVAQEQDANTAVGSTEQDQRRGADFLIYETDSEQEARALNQEGGFIKNDKWHVITAVTDSNNSDATQPHPARTASSFPERP